MFYLSNTIKKAIALFLIFSFTLSGCSEKNAGEWGATLPYWTGTQTAKTPTVWSTLKNVLSPNNREDIWDSLRYSFVLPHYENHPAVQREIQWFIRHPDYLRRTCLRAAPYMYYIMQQVKARNLPGELVLLPMQESAYNPFVSSNVGAAGLWQIMPMTAHHLGLHKSQWYDGRRDVFFSTRAALDYLSYLQKFFNGNWYLAIAAYDAGEGRVASALRYNNHHGQSKDFFALPLPQETRTYLPRLLALAAIISHPERYPVQLPHIKNSAYFARVPITHPISLAKAAELANISIDEMYLLNSGYHRFFAGRDGPKQLLIPTQKLTMFQERLEQYEQSNSMASTHDAKSLKQLVRQENPQNLLQSQQLATLYRMPTTKRLFAAINNPSSPSGISSTTKSKKRSRTSLAMRKRNRANAVG